MSSSNCRLHPPVGSVRGVSMVSGWYPCTVHPGNCPYENSFHTFGSIIAVIWSSVFVCGAAGVLPLATQFTGTTRTWCGLPIGFGWATYWVSGSQPVKADEPAKTCVRYDMTPAPSSPKTATRPLSPASAATGPPCPSGIATNGSHAEPPAVVCVASNNEPPGSVPTISSVPLVLPAMAIAPRVPGICTHPDQVWLLAAVWLWCQICPAPLTPTTSMRPSALVCAATCLS